MSLSQRFLSVGTVLIGLAMVPAWAAPEVVESGTRVTVTGQGYRAVFTRDLADVRFELKAPDGSWLPLVQKGTVPDTGVFVDGNPQLLGGVQCGWLLQPVDHAVIVAWTAPLDPSGKLSMHVIFHCTDEGILIGSRLNNTRSEPVNGSFWFPPRLALDPDHWDSYAFHDAADRRHAGMLADLSPCPAYAGVTSWGKTGDVVASLSDSLPALIVRDGTSGAAFGFVYVDWPEAWRNSGIFLQRHLPERTYFYAGHTPIGPKRTYWAWFAPFGKSEDDAARIKRLLATAKRELVASGIKLPQLPQVAAPIPDFPAALRRSEPVREIRDAVVYTMNETTNSDYALDLIRKTGPDLAIRGWFKWNQRPPVEKWTRFPQDVHRLGSLFGGGITCSALYEGENGITRDQLLDMATRGADGQLVDAWDTPGIRHGSLSSPAYLDYLFRWCKEQIDAGIDYLFMDETNAALSVREGYDDHSLRDFRTYLLQECPRTRGWRADDLRWTKEFGIALDDPAVCPSRRMDSFDYRAFLRIGGWLEEPWASANPMANVWREFRSWRDDRAWKSLTDRIRVYAAEKGRTVLISGNGLVPYVDLQVLGVWGDWGLQNGHIDLRQNQVQIWRTKIRQGRKVAGADVPVVLFHDWGFGDPPFPWLAVPPSEREVWMRTRGAEIYASGAFFAFPVLGPFGCDAGRDGTLGTIARQAAFYQSHRDLYTGSRWLGCEGLDAGERPLSLTAWWHEASSSVVLHVVNRDAREGVLQPVTEPLEIRVPVSSLPDRATAISPDAGTPPPVETRQAADDVVVRLPGLDAYSVVVLHYAKQPALARLTDPVRVRPMGRWERPETSQFRVTPNGGVDQEDKLNGFLQGMLHTGLRNPPVFSYASRTPGEFRVHVRAVAAAGARLVVRLDDASPTVVDLPDRDGKNAGSVAEYDQTFTFPLPAGQHRVLLDNTGADWLTLGWLEFKGTFGE